LGNGRLLPKSDFSLFNLLWNRVVIPTFSSALLLYLFLLDFSEILLKLRHSAIPHHSSPFNNLNLTLGLRNKESIFFDLITLYDFLIFDFDVGIPQLPISDFLLCSDSFEDFLVSFFSDCFTFWGFVLGEQ